MPILDAVFVGKIYLPEVGGGPIQPPGQPPTQPPGIWGPGGPWPTPPIYIPPTGGGGGTPPVGGYPGYPAPPEQIWPKPDFPHVGGGPVIPPTEPPVLWPPAGVVSPPIYLPPQIWPTPPAKPPVEGQPPEIWPKPDFPHTSQPISGGGYIIGWSPQLGYVKIPIGGAPPAGSGDSGAHPEHPIVPPEGTPPPPEAPVVTPH